MVSAGQKLAAVGCLTVAITWVTAGAASSRLATVAPCGPDRFVPDRPGSDGPIQAFFQGRSYAPGEVARLVVERAPSDTTAQIFHADAGPAPPRGGGVMSGLPVSSSFRVHGGIVDVRVGGWESGLYFARLQSGRAVGYAPVIVRARKPG